MFAYINFGRIIITDDLKEKKFCIDCTHQHLRNFVTLIYLDQFEEKVI